MHYYLELSRIIKAGNFSQHHIKHFYKTRKFHYIRLLLPNLHNFFLTRRSGSELLAMILACDMVYIKNNFQFRALLI